MAKVLCQRESISLQLLFTKSRLIILNIMQQTPALQASDIQKTSLRNCVMFCLLCSSIFWTIMTLPL